MATSKPSAASKSAKATKKTAKPAPADAVAMKSAAPAQARKPITAEQAMANTLALLKAKNKKAKQPRGYPTGDAGPPGSHGQHGFDASQPETAPTERLAQAIHGHAYATETGDESKRSQS